MNLDDDLYNFCDDLADEWDCVFDFRRSGHNVASGMYYLYFDYVTQVRDEGTWEDTFLTAFPELTDADAIYEGGGREREMWIQVYY